MVMDIWKIDPMPFFPFSSASQPPRFRDVLVFDRGFDLLLSAIATGPEEVFPRDSISSISSDSSSSGMSTDGNSNLFLTLNN